MKKILSTVLLVTLIGTCSFAQGFKFGPKAGLNISNYTGDDVESDALVGFHLGGLLSFGIGEVFSIQPEVLFSTQGAKIKDNNSKFDFKTNYLSVPVMLKFKTRGGFYLEAGPQASIKLNEKTGNTSINQNAKDLDIALGAGLGYQAGFGLGIGARYVAGISKAGNFDIGNIKPDYKNSVIQVGLFWAIPVR